VTGASDIDSKLDPQASSSGHIKSFSISKRLAFGLIIAALLVSASTITGFYLKEMRDQEIDVTRKADEYRDHLVGALQQPLWNFDEATISRICSAVMQNELVVGIEIKGGLGQVTYRYGSKIETV
jgi:hypothetical protein